MKKFKIQIYQKAIGLILPESSSTYYTYLDNVNTFNINELDFGWNLISTTTTVTKDKLDGAIIVWQWMNGVWKAYSSDNYISEVLDSSGYEQIQSISPYSSYWIYK